MTASDAPTEADMCDYMIVLANVQHRQAFRDTEQGSFFIQVKNCDFYFTVFTQTSVFLIVFSQDSSFVLFFFLFEHFLLFQALCQSLQSHGDSHSFSDILLHLRSVFKHKTITLDNGTVAMQMPPETNVLTKKLVLKRVID